MIGLSDPRLCEASVRAAGPVCDCVRFFSFFFFGATQNLYFISLLNYNSGFLEIPVFYLKFIFESKIVISTTGGAAEKMWEQRDENSLYLCCWFSC